jgi:chemotaxis signal transduction protein
VTVAAEAAAPESAAAPVDGAHSLPDLSRQVVLLQIGAERVGLVVAEVVAVLDQARLSAVPKAPPGVLGIMNHVGSVLIVVSLAAVLGLPESPATQTPFVVVLERQGDRIGVQVDRVERITLTVNLAQDVRTEPRARLARGWLTYEGTEVRLVDGAAVVGEVLARFERRA